MEIGMEHECPTDKMSIQKQQCPSIDILTDQLSTIMLSVVLYDQDHYQYMPLPLLLLILHPFNGLFFQDNLGKPAPER